MRAVFGIGAVVLLLGSAVLISRGFGPSGTVVLSNARAELSMMALNSVDIFVTMQNGAEPDLLLGASSALGPVELINPDGAGAPPIPAFNDVSLSLDGVFLRLSGFDSLPEEGQLLPFTLVFENSGALSSRAVMGRAADLHGTHQALGDLWEGEELVAEGHALPSLDLAMTQLDDGGWQVILETRDFTFAPDSPEPEHVPSHGHAHLYINGLKVQRMHGPEAVIGALPQGAYLVRAAINSNDHRPYIDANGPIEAVLRLRVE